MLFWKKLNHRLENSMVLSRMGDLTLLPKKERMPYIENYIKRKLSTKIGVSKIIILGDSQLYGKYVTSKEVFTEIPPLKNLEVVNLSFINGNLKDFKTVLKSLAEYENQIQKVVVSVNLATFTKDNISKTLLDRKKSSMKLSKFTFGRLLYQQNTTEQKGEYFLFPEIASISKKTWNEYWLLDDKFEAELDSFGDNLLNKKILFLVTPWNLEQFSQSNLNIGIIQNNNRLIQKKLEELGQVMLVEKFGPTDFYDAVHLSQSGHKKLSQLIYEMIELK